MKSIPVLDVQEDTQTLDMKLFDEIHDREIFDQEAKLILLIINSKPLPGGLSLGESRG